jgi:hypothetical protein
MLFAVMLIAVSWLLYAAGFGALIGAFKHFQKQFVAWDTVVLIGCLGAACMYASRQSMIFGRRLRRLFVTKIGIGDTRRPVLYLRSFSDDAIGEQIWLVKYRFFPIRLPALIPSVQTEDEQLATVFSKVGPFVSIAQPTSTIPRLFGSQVPGGADWRQRVVSLMESASLVIIRLSTGEYLWWEIEQAMRRLPHERIILLVHCHNQDRSLRTVLQSSGDDDYELLRGRFARELGVSLPELPFREKSLANSRLWGYVGFDRKDVALVTNFTKPANVRDWPYFLSFRFWNPLVRILRYYFGRYLDGVDVAAEPYRITRKVLRTAAYMITAAVLIAVFVFTGLVLNHNAAYLPTLVPEPSWRGFLRQALIESEPRSRVFSHIDFARLDVRRQVLYILTGSAKDETPARAQEWLREYSRMINTNSHNICLALTEKNLSMKAFLDAADQIHDERMRSLVDLSFQIEAHHMDDILLQLRFALRDRQFQDPSADQDMLTDSSYWTSLYGSPAVTPAVGEQLRTIYMKQAGSGKASGEERCLFVRHALKFYWSLPEESRSGWATALWNFFYSRPA